METFTPPSTEFHDDPSIPISTIHQPQELQVEERLETKLIITELESAATTATTTETTTPVVTPETDTESACAAMLPKPNPAKCNHDDVTTIPTTTAINTATQTITTTTTSTSRMAGSSGGGSLTPNTYSVMYVSDPTSQGFYFAIIFFFFQVSLASLALVDLIQLDSTNNVLNVPADIEPYVRVAGYLALVLAVPLFADLLDSIERIHEGYDPIVLEQVPHATSYKFWFAYTCQLLSGALFQIVIFSLIAQSTTVIGMLLNFAALTFITEVDDVAFSLAKRGYFGESIQQTACIVLEFQTPPTKRSPWLRRIIFAIVIVIVCTLYSILFIRQRNGVYLCNRLEVQFGDAAWSELPLHSGVYTVNKYKQENDRFVYVDEVSGTSMFRYCRNQKAWVFGYIDLSSVETQDNDDYYGRVCGDNGWFMRSKETNSFDIRETNPSEWLVVTPEDNKLVYPTDHFVMKCIDCQEDTCNGLGGECLDAPEISDAQVCVCNDDFTGNECQFEVTTSVCDSITYDHRFGPFRESGIDYATTFQLVRDRVNGSMMMDLYGKAAYAFIHGDPNVNSYGFLDLVVFFGRRYFLLEFYWLGLFPNATIETVAALYMEYLRGFQSLGASLDAQSGLTRPVFVSEPIDVGTSQDTLIPTQLGWFYTTTDKEGYPLKPGPAIDTRLVCEQCDDFSISCGRFGKCVYRDDQDWFGVCECDEFYIGPHCEQFDPLAAAAAATSNRTFT